VVTVFFIHWFLSFQDGQAPVFRPGFDSCGQERLPIMRKTILTFVRTVERNVFDLVGDRKALPCKYQPLLVNFYRLANGAKGRSAAQCGILSLSNTPLLAGT